MMNRTLCRHLWRIGVLLIFFEEFEVHVIDCLGFYAEAKPLKHIDQLFAVNEFDRMRTVSARLVVRIACKESRSNENALVGTPHHRTTKVTNCGRTNRAFVAFTLKNHFKAQKRINFKHTFTINSTVSRPSSDFYFFES